MKDIINIKDTIFSGYDYITDIFPNNEFIWNRNEHGFTSDTFTLFTDSEILHASKYNTRRIAWLIESPIITPVYYEFIKNNHNLFEYVFTYDSELLQLDTKKFIFLPYGSTWITLEDQKIYNKTKLLSIIASDKRRTEGHRLRHDIINQFRGSIDVFGRGYVEIPTKTIGLSEYAYQIVVENVKKDYYFTEKIMDCFATGTIPIYHGCPSIGKFFDSDAIMAFDNINDLKNIISNISLDHYNSKKEVIHKNFAKMKEFVNLDYNVYKEIKKL